MNSSDSPRSQAKVTSFPLIHSGHRLVAVKVLMNRRLLWWLSIALTLPLLLLGVCYGAGVRLPEGQPVQMRTQVNYDPNLSDPFFDTQESYTARVFTKFQYDRFINFCEARLLDGDTIELFIHERNPANNDNLRIVVENGAFWSQYWYYYKDFSVTTEA